MRATVGEPPLLSSPLFSSLALSPHLSRVLLFLFVEPESILFLLLLFLLQLGEERETQKAQLSMSSLPAASKKKAKASTKDVKKSKREHALRTQSILKSLKQKNSPLPIDNHPSWMHYEADELAVQLRYYHGDSMPKELSTWAFELMKGSMRDFYDRCPGWGWKDRAKRRELMDSDARFIVALKQQGHRQSKSEKETASSKREVENSNHNIPIDVVNHNQPKSTIEEQADDLPTDSSEESPVAFVHLRFEEERGDPVLYLWELQVEPFAQGKGLGRFLMQLLEEIARQGNLRLVMLTVFRENMKALSLYRKLGYVDDESSPGREEGYAILSKQVGR